MKILRKEKYLKIEKRAMNICDLFECLETYKSYYQINLQVFAALATLESEKLLGALAPGNYAAWPRFVRATLLRERSSMATLTAALTTVRRASGDFPISRFYMWSGMRHSRAVAISFLWSSAWLQRVLSPWMQIHWSCRLDADRLLALRSHLGFL